MQPKRTLFQKKGAGVYQRVSFFIGAKSVKHNLAEVSSLPRSSTFHEFRDIGQCHEGFVKCTKLSCHRCIKCQNLRPHECLNSHRTGEQLLKQVTLKSGGAVEVPLLCLAVGINGKANTAEVKVGTLFSVELHSIQEPWMIAKATSELHKYDGPIKMTWMGRIEPGDVMTIAIKLDPTAAGLNTLISSATRKCRRPLTYNCGVCRRASVAAPGARPWPDAACPGAGAARSLNGQLKRAVCRRADSEATCTCAIATRAAYAHAEYWCTCACAWLRAGLHRPHGRRRTNPGHSRMHAQLTHRAISA